MIHFDGTLILVFDLKREIILANQLGLGVDFNLKLYHAENPSLEYELDTDIIPRSTYVLVKRSPSHTRGGRYNNALRYVSGKPRIKRAAMGQASSHVATTGTVADENMSEEDRIKMMFENQLNAWANAQDELAQHKVIHYSHAAAGAGANTAARKDDIPPPGYICYRCGKKDHWMKNCPLISDPNFDNKKILRTTGIPKSLLRTINKDDFNEDNLTKNENGELFDKDGNAILVTEDGDYAIAVADSKTWKTYQEKQQNAAAKQKREFDNKIIGCVQRDNRLQYLDPLKLEPTLLRSPIVTTPCCPTLDKVNKLKNIYYHQPDLEQTLIENDFTCPNCGAEDVFIDSLVPAPDLESELHHYMEEKQKELDIADPASRKRERDDDNNDPDDADSKRAKGDDYAMNNMPFMPFPMFMPPPPPQYK